MERRRLTWADIAWHVLNHTPSVKRFKKGWFPSCACGWIDRFARTRDEAQRAHQKHKAREKGV